MRQWCSKYDKCMWLTVCMPAANPSDKVHLASGFTDGPWVILVTVLESKRRDTSCAKRRCRRSLEKVGKPKWNWSWRSHQNLNVEKAWNLANISIRINKKRWWRWWIGWKRPLCCNWLPASVCLGPQLHMIHTHTAYTALCDTYTVKHCIHRSRHNTQNTHSHTLQTQKTWTPKKITHTATIHQTYILTDCKHKTTYIHQ